VVIARARDDVRAVVAWSLRDEKWDFALAEQSFGETAAWPPLRLEAAGAPLWLQGKIDRVDLSERAVRAIDYKSSRRAADAGTRDMGATAFQVPLYALVAARATGRSDAHGLYLPTPARELRQVREPSPDRWGTLLGSVENLAADVVGTLRRGALAPIPRDKTACARCHVRGGCRRPRFAVAPDEEEAAGGSR
jgi:hypothetical protein